MLQDSYKMGIFINQGMFLLREIEVDEQLSKNNKVQQMLRFLHETVLF